jgi:hypothetical protein
MAQDGELIWPSDFIQVWRQVYSPDGNRLAAVVAPKYGRWTVAVDGKAWRSLFKDMVVDAVWSPDSSRLAALGKNGPDWHLMVDDKIWQHRFAMAWAPVFSPAGDVVAAKVEVDGGYTLVVNDRLWSHRCEAVWDPVFSPAGDKLLVKTIEDGIYHRRVLPVAEFLD